MDNKHNIEKLDMSTPNITDNNVARIAELFPNVVTEGRDENGKLTHVIDFDALKQELSDSIVEGPQERYRLDWPGKREAMLAANTPITKTFRPVREESVDFDTTKNLFIEGDNLDALKLLQETYLGKVKMIYIDPPYNTGKDFIYKDNFTGDKQEYLEDSGQVNEDGGKLVANPESNGRYHSDWLSMMYPRLKLARNLLRDDGVIFISIDQYEQSNLQEFCNELFGLENLVGCVTVINNMKGRNDKKNIATAHEYLLIYSKSEFLSRGVPLSDEQLKEYKFADKNGYKYALRDLRKRGRPDRREDRPNMYFPIYYNKTSKALSLEKQSEEDVEITPLRGDKTDGRWRWGKDSVEKNLAILHAKYSAKKDRWDISHRVYLNPSANESVEDEEDDDDDNIQRTSKIKSFLWGGEISTDVANREFKKLFPGLNPDYPKSVFLLDKIVHMGSGPGDIVMDFFGGYSTTAHSTLRNGLVNGNRHFIIVQITNELTDSNKEHLETYTYCINNNLDPSIAAVSKERIRRAGKNILEDNPDQVGKLDVGFRVLKIDNSNMNDVYYAPGELEQATLLDAVDHIKPDRTAEDLLFQVMLDWGVDLSLPIVREEIDGKTVFWVGDDDLAACFDLKISEDIVKVMAERKPLRAVFRDDGFGSDDMKINAGQLFAQMTDGHTDMKVI